MSIEEESNGYRNDHVTGTGCVFCGGHGYIEIYRGDWEEFEEIECGCCRDLKKKV